ncbi:hypothetical protein PVAND_001845 [Polypedilum vanderplanki]|uniref:Small subunit processome component 20-like protein n=1 Tax=Polypedilum vanderplanki TaxID=319348 RepID=A0A9J6BPK9_POLVA|nr:hypothetical protein PVAND_001845 [Polypedilum vanderplanki]
MPKKHKDENIFKFKKFSDRIAEVDLRSSALYKIEHANEIPDENRSYFCQTLDKWNTLNLTEEFCEFEKHFRKIHTTTLPQLLHHKDQVIEILICHLEKATTLSLQPILELTVALAKDLREEFYVHFQKFFDILIGLLNTQDADQTEWTLICLAHLFKILKPFLSKEISIVINRIIPLMSENNQPEHVINFAVECFAFIVRSLRDKDFFLLTILKKVTQDETCIMGCGKLFCEMIRGLNGQFHSKGEEFLTLLFNTFRRNEYKKYSDILKEILVQTIGDILSYIENKYISTYWNVLHKAFENILSEESMSLDEKSTSIHYLLYFLGQSVEYYGGQKITDIQKIINLVIQILDHEFSLEVAKTVSQIGAVLLLSKNFMIGQLEASRLAKKILNTEHVEVFESFVINSINCTQFDILIMPDFLRYFERNYSKSSMEIFAKIIEVRKSNELLDNSEFNGYNIHFKNQKTLDALTNCILSYSPKREECEEFHLAIQILPHLVSYPKEKIEQHLKKIIKDLIQNLEDDIKNIFLLAVVVSTIHNISGSFETSEILEIIDAVLKIKNTFTKLKLIKYFINILKKQNQSSLDNNLFNKIKTSLVDNLLSRYQQMRLLTSQILASFNHLKKGKESVYSIFKEIEEIIPTIQTYRDQILLLQKLEYDSAFFQEIKSTPFAEDALKFCIGFLHVNFQPLWDTIKSVLESYINNFDINTCWNIFYNQLKSVRCEQFEFENAPLNNFTKNEFIKEKFNEFVTVTDRYDAISYRVKLLQILFESKSNIIDVKQRDVVELFFEFLHNEYESEEETNEEAPKGRQKLLINHLQVLSKFSNPKCVSKTEELRKLYIEFLLHRNFQVQKLALDCILQYKEISLTNYKEILYNCVNEKTSRNEIMVLNLDEKIQDEHRDGFMEIFLPILYSKLTIKANKKDQEGFKTKKEVIVRFMNHLKENELLKLTDIAVGKISEVTWNTNPKLFIKHISEVHFRGNELQSKLQFLDMIKKNVAGTFSEDYQRKVLRSILTIASCTVNNDTAIYKNLKQLCQHSVVEFFEQYDNFTWNESEIELIFEIFIWKHLETFSKDASQNVTGLMKLFVEWSKNPKYFVYLERKNNNGHYPIKSILELLNNKSTAAVVIECVMEILERLLTLISDNETVTTINFGTQLIEPFIKDILLKLKDKMSGKKTKTMGQRNLLILSRVTELVKDQEASKILLDILLPLTLRKIAEDSHDSDGIMKLLITISNLLKVVNQPEFYLRSYAPLFEHVVEVNQRKYLVKTFNILCQNDEFLKEVVNDINAYDKRWIEQPDFEKRLSAFHRLEMADISIELAVVIIYHCFYFLKHEKDLAIRDNSSHYLKLICSKIISKYSSDKTQLDYFVDKVILNLLSKKIRGNAEMRTEAIILLGELARNHPQVHSILNDLHSLTDANNRELDFFDNVTHLQKFRHMKALRRFVEIAKTYKQIPNLRTLNDFLLPISKIFLCTDEYQKKSKVIEAAIDYVACICKFLPWNQYEMVLKFYLNKMKNDSKAYQKQLVKLIPAILDSFHYSLSSFNDEASLETKQIIEEEKQTEKEEINADDESESDNEDNEEEELIDEEEEQEEKSSKAIEEITILKPNVSQRVIKSLTKRLIPSLFKIINELSNTTAHKLNKEERRLKEKADMIKIPIALPMIKLLQKLPSKFLQQYLSQVVLKVSSFLKSTLKQVRATARHTLKEILVSLGVEHLEIVIENLSGILSKGFQIHVLSVTVHTLIDALKNQLVSSNVTEKILQRVLDVCLNDIFGKNNEEHEIGKIGNRTPEAKASRKSFLTLNILASTLSEKCILDLILPFKNLLLETQSKKIVIKIQECFVQIASGLTVNTKIPIDALMILIHGTISESIPNLLPEKKKADVKNVKKLDCFIIQEEPKRRGATAMNKNVKLNKQTNTYVLVEFGLEMLHILMKKKKLENAEGFLEPLIALLVDSMKGNFLRVNMLAIRCFTIMWHHKMEIDSLKVHTVNIAQEIFNILHKYATTEISRKDNHYLLVKSTFKSVVVLIRHVDYYTVNENQLKALLLYIEQDITHGNDKDTISFVLLKAILDRKLIVPEIHDVMKKIAEMSITSDVVERRTVMRPIILTYLMEYPLGKKIDQLMKFFIAQLNYEEISGRESAIDMIHLMFKNFPQAQLCKFSGLFFLALGTRLVNDDSPNCREKIALALELLIAQVSNESKLQLYDIVIMLLKDKKLVHREMAAQLIIRFINAAGKDFIISRMANLLSLLLKSITNTLDDSDDEPGKYVRVKRQKLNDDDDDDANMIDIRDQQTIEDHHLIQTLNAIIKIFEYDEGAIMKDENSGYTIDEIGYRVHTLLSHDHTWVRLRSLKIINLLIKRLDLVRVHEILKNEVQKDEENGEYVKFLYSKMQFQSVAFDMVVQLKSDVEQELLTAIFETLIEISKVLKDLPFTGMINDKKDFNLFWLIRRLRYAIHNEIAAAPNSCVLRKSIFHFFNNLLDIIDRKTIMRLASSMLTPMLREMVEGEHVIDELKQVAMQVGNRIKTLIGLQEYDKVRMELQSKMLRKRVDRRKNLAQEKINNPAKAAARTIMKQLKKKDNKRQKRKEIQEGIVLPRKKRKIFGNSMTDTYE